MTDLRDLLHQATADLDVDQAGAVDRVRHAIRRRRRFQVATVGVVAAVAAAIAVPVAVAQTNGGGQVQVGHSPTPRPSPTPAHHELVQHWAPDDGAVASGYGAVWGIQCCGGSTSPSWIDKLDPRTGEQLAHIPLPGPTTRVAAGAGRVWTIGATDSGPSAISVVDPVTLHATTMRLPDPKAEPDDIAFTGGSAWVTFNLLNQVWRLTPTASGVDKSVLRVGGSPESIATTGNGQLWVQSFLSNHSNDTDALTRIVPTPTGGRLGQSVQWGGAVYSPGIDGSVLASFGEHTITFLGPANLSSCDACAQDEDIFVRGPQIYDAIWTVRGLFVSTFAGTPASGSQGHTYFWSRRALNATEEKPTGTIRGGGSLAADGLGVVIGDGQGGIIHWVPAA